MVLYLYAYRLKRKKYFKGQDFFPSFTDKLILQFLVCLGYREVYHLKRMQRVQTVMWSRDNKYLLSGSDEMGIRLWKAKASEKLGTVSTEINSLINFPVQIYGLIRVLMGVGMMILVLKVDIQNEHQTYIMKT